jgi:hypothetical protein
MISQAFTITTTRQQIVAPAPSSRWIYIHMTGNAIVYLGGADVTTTNGMSTEKGTVPFEMFLPSNEALFAVCASTENLRLMRPSADGN